MSDNKRQVRSTAWRPRLESFTRVFSRPTAAVSDQDCDLASIARFSCNGGVRPSPGPHLRRPAGLRALKCHRPASAGGGLAPPPRGAPAGRRRDGQGTAVAGPLADRRTSGGGWPGLADLDTRPGGGQGPGGGAPRVRAVTPGAGAHAQASRVRGTRGRGAATGDGRRQQLI